MIKNLTIIILIFFSSCYHPEKNIKLSRKWYLHEYKGYYSLVLEIKNNSNNKYYLHHWLGNGSLAILDSLNNDITTNYFIEEGFFKTMFIHNYGYQFSERDTIDISVSSLFKVPINKKNSFIRCALEKELNRQRLANINDSLFVKFFYSGLLEIYRNSEPIEVNTIFKDSIPVHSCIVSNEPVTIIVKYRNTSPIGYEGYTYFNKFNPEFKQDSIYFSGKPLKIVGDYTLLEQEFTDTIFLKGDKIKVRYSE